MSVELEASVNVTALKVPFDVSRTSVAEVASMKVTKNPLKISKTSVPLDASVKVLISPAPAGVYVIVGTSAALAASVNVLVFASVSST